MHGRFRQAASAEQRVLDLQPIRSFEAQLAHMLFPAGKRLERTNQEAERH